MVLHGEDEHAPLPALDVGHLGGDDRVGGNIEGLEEAGVCYERVYLLLGLLLLWAFSIIMADFVFRKE